MPKDVAAPKNTGGGGFVFEDQVVAYFLACLLTDQPPLDPALGTIVRVDFQARVDGWFLDDVVATLAVPTMTRRCALSIKSNRQFSKDAAPADFVCAAWEQYLHEGADPFDRSADLLGLITTPLPEELSDPLDELLLWARAQDPAGLPARLAEPGFASEPKRRLFASFACPSDLAGKHSVTETETGKLLARLVFPSFDFERDPSADYSVHSSAAGARCALAP
jgi:hypothetical protein